MTPNSNMAREILKVKKARAKYLNPLNFKASIDDLYNEILITPQADTLQNSRFDGLQIILDLTTGLYEFSEYQAGPNADKLYIYGYYKTPAAAFKRMLKGPKAAPVKIW